MASSNIYDDAILYYIENAVHQSKIEIGNEIHKSLDQRMQSMSVDLQDQVSLKSYVPSERLL